MHCLYKKVLGFCAVLLCCPLQAQSVVGVVDVNAIMRADPKFQQSQVELEKEHGKYEREFQKIQESLSREGNGLASLRGNMDSATFEKKKKELEDKLNKLQGEMVEKKRSLDEKYQKVIADLQDRVQSVLKKLIEDRSISYVLDQQFLLAINDKLKEEVQNLTGEVIAQLNELSRKEKVPTPPSR